MAVDKIADDFDKGTRSLMIDQREGLYDDRIDNLVGGFLSGTANAQPSLG